MEEKFVRLGEKITDIKKHLLCIQIGRIYHKYNFSHPFSKKILEKFKFHILCNCLQKIIETHCPQLDLVEFDGIRISNCDRVYLDKGKYERPYEFESNVFYRDYEIWKLCNRKPNSLTQFEYDYIQEWINKFKSLIEYLNDFETDFTIPGNSLKDIKKECKKFDKKIISLQKLLEEQVIDNDLDNIKKLLERKITNKTKNKKN